MYPYSANLPPPPHGQQPYGQPHNAQQPYGQPHNAQQPYGQPHYAQQPYGQPPNAQQPYGPSPYPQQAYAQPPYGQPYGGSAAAPKDVDPIRMLIGAGSCGALAMFALVVLVTLALDDFGGIWGVFFFTLLQVVGVAGLGVATTGFRSLAGKIAAGAAAAAASTVFVAHGVIFMGVGGQFVESLMRWGTVGWMVIASLAICAALGAAKKRSRVVAAGGGLFGLAGLTTLADLVRIGITDTRASFELSYFGAHTAGLVVLLVASMVTSVGFVLVHNSLGKPAR